MRIALNETTILDEEPVLKRVKVEPVAWLHDGWVWLDKGQIPPRLVNNVIPLYTQQGLYETTPEEFAELMKEIQVKFGDDEEIAHTHMDALMVKVLVELGFHAGVAIFDKQKKWYA